MRFKNVFLSYSGIILLTISRHLVSATANTTIKNYPEFRNVSVADKKNFQVPASLKHIEKAWVTQLVEQIRKELNLYGTIIRGPNISDLLGTEFDVIVKEFSKYLPTMQLEEKYVLTNNDTRHVFETSTITRPRSVLVVSAIKENYWADEFSYNLTVEIVENISTGIFGSVHQPRVLQIIFGRDKLFKNRTSNFEKYFEKILLYGWREKFADITILYVPGNRRLKPQAIYYNMFEKNFYKMSLSHGNKRAVIFPNKFKDMKGFRLSLGYAGNIDDINKMEEIIYAPKIQLSSESLLCARRFFCKVHNCTMRLIKYKYQHHPHYCKKRLEPNIYFSATMIWSFKHLKQFPVFVSLQSQDFKAAIPHTTKEAVVYFAYSHLLLFFAIITVCSALVYLVLKVSQFGQRNWTYLDVLCCILGSSLSADGNFRQKLAYLLLIFLSFYVGNDFVDLATDFELETKREVIENLDGLFRLRTNKIYSSISKDIINSNYENWNFIKLTKMRSGLQGATACGMELIKTNDRMCISNENALIIASAKLLANFSVGKGLRLAHPPLRQGLVVTRLEECSPYIEEYSKVAQRSQEAGLIRAMSPKDIVNAYNLDFVDEDYDIITSDESSFYYSLFHVVLICYVLAGVVFFIEFAMVRCSWMKKIMLLGLGLLSRWYGFVKIRFREIWMNKW